MSHAANRIKKDFDKDNDYLKIAGIWHYRSKKSSGKKTKTPDDSHWTSLKNDNKTTDKLDKKYPEEATRTKTANKNTNYNKALKKEIKVVPFILPLAPKKKA